MRAETIGADGDARERPEGRSRSRRHSNRPRVYDDGTRRAVRDLESSVIAALDRAGHLREAVLRIAAARQAIERAVLDGDVAALVWADVLLADAQREVEIAETQR